MTEQIFYLRIKGKVSGPHTLAHIKTSIERGRVNRHFQISPDGKDWYSIAEERELFDSTSVVKRKVRNRRTGIIAVPPQYDQLSTFYSSSPATTTGLPAHAPNTGTNQATPLVHASSNSQAAATNEFLHSNSEQWFVFQGNQPVGPICFDALSGMHADGQLDAQTAVCRLGTTQWQTFQSVLDGTMGPVDPFSNASQLTTHHSSRLSSSHIMLIFAALGVITLTIIAILILLRLFD